MTLQRTHTSNGRLWAQRRTTMTAEAQRQAFEAQWQHAQIVASIPSAMMTVRNVAWLTLDRAFYSLEVAFGNIAASIDTKGSNDG
jgi:hypothetical protein